MLQAMRQALTQGVRRECSQLAGYSVMALQGSSELLPCFGYSQGKVRLAASPSWHHRSACFISAPTAAFILTHYFFAEVFCQLFVLQAKPAWQSSVCFCSVKRKSCDFLCNTSAACSPFEANKLLIQGRCSSICFTPHRRFQQISFQGNAFNSTHSSFNSW